jgi:HK97 family phage major capsid protein
MPFPALQEAEDQVRAKEAELKRVFDAAGPELDLKSVGRDLLPAGVKAGDTISVAEWIRKTNDELTGLKKEWESLSAVDTIKARGGEVGRVESGDGASQDNPTGRSMKSVGVQFVESHAFKRLNGRHIGDTSTLDIDMKTLMQTSAGWAPETTRNGVVVDFATRPLQVAELIPTTETTQNAVTYMEETTFTNNAAEIAEAGTYPEAALALTEQSVLVRKIAVFLPVTDEQLQDEAQVRTYVENRLAFMIRQRLDLQILVGNGTAPNLRGLLNVLNIQTQAKGADPTPDAVYKAMTKIRVTGQAEPNLIVMHPNDWMDIRLLRTPDGVYIWGNPSDAGPERMWGLRVAQAQALTENTGLVLDTQYVSLAYRRGIDVQVSNSHGTFFVEGKQAIRADVRVALVPYRPAAICTVTGI